MIEYLVLLLFLGTGEEGVNDKEVERGFLRYGEFFIFKLGGRYISVFYCYFLNCLYMCVYSFINFFVYTIYFEIIFFFRW